MAGALAGFFLEADIEESQRDAYAAYLKRRIRPAMERLIRENALEKMDVLEQRGWVHAGSVMGASEPECERRFFENWLPTQAPLRYHPSVATTPHAVAQRPAVAATETNAEPAKKRRFAFWRR